MILTLLPSIFLLTASPLQAQGAGPNVQVTSGPVRMARVSYLDGPIDWRPDYRGQWADATVNLPLREGAQIWAPGNHRAEIQFDDGSLLRLSDGAVVTLKEMYSDRDGEFTLIKLTDGAVSLTARNPHSIYQIDTPCDSVKAEGPSKVQVRAEMNSKSTDVTCRGGRAQVLGPKGTNTLQPNQRAIYDPDGSSRPQALAPPSSWDKFNDQRDERMGRPERFAPSNVGLVSGDLDEYGDWDSDPDYGHVWYPRVRETNWRPYNAGDWVWVEPVGWTWVSDEPWGWAPYHYGSWVRRHRGWGWVPGPVGQPWSPAVVNFSYDNGYVAWAPLAPREVRYGPALNVGFASGNWSLFFSIGGVASYYPAGPTWCAPSYYDPYVLRRRVDIYRTVDVYRTWRPGPRDFGRWRFMPSNGLRFAGGSVVAVSSFGRHGRFRALDPRSATIFRRGQNLAAPSGRWARSRPFFNRPTLASTTPRNRFLRNVGISRTALNRPVFHAANNRSMVARNRPIGRINAPRNAASIHRLHEAQAAARARRDLNLRHGSPALGRAARFANAHGRPAGRTNSPAVHRPNAATARAHNAPTHRGPAARRVNQGPQHRTNNVRRVNPGPQHRPAVNRPNNVRRQPNRQFAPRRPAQMNRPPRNFTSQRRPGGFDRPRNVNPRRNSPPRMRPAGPRQSGGGAPRRGGGGGRHQHGG